eukprot:COSAG06_NODE_50366_length_319_cov_0.709091_1_plen_93_part_01
MYRSARQQARQLERAREAGRDIYGGGADNGDEIDSGGGLHVVALEDALRREKETVRRLRITLREQATEMKAALALADQVRNAIFAPFLYKMHH